MQAGYRAPKTANRSADAVRRSGRQHGQDRHRKILFGTAGSETPCIHGSSMHGNQEIPVPPVAVRKRRAGGGTHKGNLLMHGAGKSDCRVLRVKVPNKRRKAGGGAGGKAADQGERKEGTHEPGTGSGNRVKGTSRRARSRTARQRVKVHNAAASGERETAFGQLLSVKETGCAGTGSTHLERI